MTLDDITPVLLSFNEEENLERTLSRLTGFSRVVLIDSGSTDATLTLAGDFQNVEVIHREFDSHARQWNFGLDQVSTPWVLSLDADYQVSTELLDEIRELGRDAGPVAYFARFRYLVFGGPLRGSILPPRAVLFQTQHCRYVDDGHTQLLQISGPSATLQNPVDHDDRKPLSRSLWAQSRYARLEAVKLTTEDSLPLADRLRRLKWLAPLLVFFYVWLVRGGFLDGRRGLYYALQRMVAEAVLALELLERDLDETG